MGALIAERQRLSHHTSYGSETQAGARGEGRFGRKTLTPTLSHGEREQDALGVGWVAADFAWVLGAAATLTPALSLKGEGGRGVRRVLDGLGFEAGLRFEGRFGRKTLTPTLSHGEREQDASPAFQHGCYPTASAGRWSSVSGEGSRAA